MELEILTALIRLEEEIGSVTWTFAEIRQYAAADCHDFEDGH